MVSARDQGQKKTQKWRIQMIIKRHKAGLSLTDEERELLVPYLHSQKAESSDEDDYTSKSTHMSKKARRSDTTPVADCIPALLTTDSAATSGNGVMEEGHKYNSFTPASLKDESNSDPVSTGSSGLSLGKSLLAQFKEVKSKADAENASRVVSKEEYRSCDYSADFANGRGPYVPGSEKNEMDKLLEMSSEPNLQATKNSVTPSTSENKNPYFVTRDNAIQAARMQLPVCGMEQEIVEAIGANDAIILCGETGSGKSTQVPQFLYEAGYCSNEGGMIGITQPRRVAARSTALRVATEMNCPLEADQAPAAEMETEDFEKKKKKKKRKIKVSALKQLVGYQVRYDASTITSDTCIKFMTDGILLREITSDFLLRKYSVVILDEAHERNVNTDILLGLLSRLGIIQLFSISFQKVCSKHSLTYRALILRREQAKEEAAVYATLPEIERLVIIILYSDLSFEC